MRHRFLWLLALPLSPLFAGEQVVLTSGFRLQAERHEMAGDKVRIITTHGVTEVAAAEVQGYEPDEVVPQAMVPSAKLPTVAVAETIPPVTAAKTPQELVAEAARRHGLPPEFVASVAAVESAYRVNALSPKGAIGLMQLMPGTARELNADAHDPVQNADAGARLLRQLLVQYEGRPELALAAYNAGPGAVARYGGIPPYRETQQYVAKVLKRYVKATQGGTGR